MKYNDENIINYEAMGGWPIYKMTVRQILEELGCKLNSETGMYEISKDNPVLDACPALFEDDGMGYGVNRQYITEVSHFEAEGKTIVHMFRDVKIDNAPMWRETQFYYYATVEYNNKEGFAIDIRKNDNGEIEILFQHYKTKDEIETYWVKPEELKYFE